jgi:hypothetical protein
VQDIGGCKQHRERRTKSSEPNQRPPPPCQSGSPINAE